MRRDVPGFLIVRALAALVLAAASIGQVSAQSNADCLGCHSDTSLSKPGARKGSLFVRESALKATAHGQLGCTDCHLGLDMSKIPHAARVEPVDCLMCHSDAASKHTVHKGMIDAAAGSGGCKDCHGTHMSRTLNGGCGTCHGDVERTFAQSAHGRALRSWVRGAPHCFSCHKSDVVNHREGRSQAELKIAQEKMCLSCHLKDPKVAGRTVPGARFVDAYTKSIHSSELLKGNGNAANCVDCHGAHEMEKGISPTASVNKAHIPATCGKCHSAIEKEYSQSIHGVAAAKGNMDSPVCTDCHGEHSIYRHDDPRSPVAPRNLSAKVCGTCHSSVKLSEKYGIASDRFQTFSDSYHGLAIRGGSLNAANCASCHGAHGIKPSSDRTSPVNKRNLPATCGKCHPGANTRFAVGKVHLTVTPEKEPLLYIIGLAYVLLIVATIGGMLAHNGLDLYKKWRRHVDAHDLHGLYVRMSVSERIQHALLAVSFVALAITGFMLHYPDAWWVKGIRSLSPDVFDLRSLLHRVAAVVMVAAALYHVYYVRFTSRGRELIRDLMPTRQDARELVQMVKHLLGRTPDKPRFGRFGYIEKSEYWALVWGTVIMTLTGVVMWMENTFIALLTKLGWDVARTIHFYEAWLAVLAIIVWHLYFVIFNPDVYPMNAAWLTGTLPEDVVAEEHPLEYEQLKQRLREREGGEAQGAEGDAEKEPDDQAQ